MPDKKMTLPLGNNNIRIFFQCNELDNLLVESRRREDIVDDIGKFLLREHNNFIDPVVIKVRGVGTPNQKTVTRGPGSRSVFISSAFPA